VARLAQCEGHPLSKTTPSVGRHKRLLGTGVNVLHGAVLWFCSVHRMEPVRNWDVLWSIVVGEISSSRSVRFFASNITQEGTRSHHLLWWEAVGDCAPSRHLSSGSTCLCCLKPCHYYWSRAASTVIGYSGESWLHSMFGSNQVLHLNQLMKPKG